MKTFRKFLESCEPINEAEYNKEWWDSKSDSFKQRYIERHPNSIYAQKGMGGKDVSYDEFKNRNKLSKDEKKAAWDREQKKYKANQDSINKKNTSVKGVNSLLKDKSTASSDFEKAATVLLDKPKNEEPWMRKVIALAEHPYTPESVIRRMEKEQPFVALHSPKASLEFLDAQVNKLDPMSDYTWIDVLVQNPALDTSQREIMAKKLKKAIKDTDKLKVDDNGSPIIDSQKDYMKERFQWQLDQLLKK